jgi:hypothetical protein
MTTGQHPAVNNGTLHAATPLSLVPSAPITPAAYEAALNALPPSLKPWLIVAVVVFSGGGIANIVALWNAPKEIAQTRAEVAELREVVCLLAGKEGIEADACRYRR